MGTVKELTSELQLPLRFFRLQNRGRSSEFVRLWNGEVNRGKRVRINFKLSLPDLVSRFQAIFLRR